MYAELLQWWPYGERWLFVAATQVVYFFFFGLHNAFLWMCYQNNWFLKYKTQGSKLPEGDLRRECLRDNLVGFFVMNPLTYYLIFPVLEVFYFVFLVLLSGGSLSLSLSLSLGFFA